MIKKELNPEQGKRLRECLEDTRMSQKELAKKTGYTPQYISNIINGKRNMSLESAQIFADSLGVWRKYLLCETKYKTIYDLTESNVEYNSNIRCTAEKIVEQLGYQKMCAYWYGWANMECPDHTEEELSDYKDHTTFEEISVSGKSFARQVIEIKKPNKEIMTCDRSDYDKFIDEIIRYVKFKLDLLEKIFNFDLVDQDDNTVGKEEGSVVQQYKPNRANEYAALLNAKIEGEFWDF